MEPGSGADDTVVAVTVSLGEAGWDSLEPVRGGIIEVYLDDTDQTFSTEGLVAVFLIISVSIALVSWKSKVLALAMEPSMQTFLPSSTDVEVPSTFASPSHAPRRK